MRILWIAQNGGLYKNNKIKGTGGWIGALQSEITKRFPELELGITFPHKYDHELINEGKITYIPFSTGESNNKILRGISHLFHGYDRIEKKYTESILSAISCYNPDIVHMWGLEQVHASALPHIVKPCIVHIQGLTSLYKFTYCTPFFSENDLKNCDSLFERILMKHGHWANYKEFLSRAKREVRYAHYVKNWIGRTDWDSHASKLLSPKSNYYHCEEVMRADFDRNLSWEYHYTEILHIQSNISEEWYKGIDIVLKTANLLKQLGVSFQWNVYGVDRHSKIVRYFMKRFKITPEEVNVLFHGKVDGKTICTALLESDVYMHPSYIENSSNAIAEAMLLGVPTIANFVGGNPSMLRNDSGILVAPNEPYSLAYHLMTMRDKNIAEMYSQNAKDLAIMRQDNFKTVNTLMDIYIDVLSSK